VNDQSHPLNPMRDFLGRSDQQKDRIDTVDDGDDDDEDDDPARAMAHLTQKGYNLIYVLDAIYHFPPSLNSFLSHTLKALTPGGVIAYTDILPPTSGLNIFTAQVLSFITATPLTNLVSRPRDLNEYKAEIEALGFVDVRVADWSNNVLPGFASNLMGRDGLWPYIGRWVKRASEESGWRFLAVRAERPRQ
jgi:hypothetical protein